MNAPFRKDSTTVLKYCCESAFIFSSWNNKYLRNSLQYYCLKTDSKQLHVVKNQSTQSDLNIYKIAPEIPYAYPEIEDSLAYLSSKISQDIFEVFNWLKIQKDLEI